MTKIMFHNKTNKYYECKKNPFQENLKGIFNIKLIKHQYTDVSSFLLELFDSFNTSQSSLTLKCAASS